MGRTELQQIIHDFHILNCLECGKCAGACPLAQAGATLSPRLVALKVVNRGLADPYVRQAAWSCLTCGLCLERCPSGIDFGRFLAELRGLYLQQEFPGAPSHGGALQTIMRLQAAKGLQQNRLDWLTDDLKTGQAGETIYFSGCLPYFEAYFGELNLNLTATAVDSVRALNHLGVTPVVLPNERCCGHDLYYGGDRESFNRLKEQNLAAFKATGAKRIVASCAECVHTLKDLYRSEDHGLEVVHLSQAIYEAEPDLNQTGRRAVFQDPCRMSRFLKIIDQPRRVLDRAVDLAEPAHYGTGSWCCGNSAWLNCGRTNKKHQQARLAEFDRAGAELIVTACPKCRIHLACALRDPDCRDYDFELIDFASVAAQGMGAT